MNRLDWGANDQKDWSARSVRGVAFVMWLQHLTANTPFAANPLDLSKIPATLSFQTGGEDIKIFTGVIAPLVLESAFLNANFQQNLQIGTYVAPVYIAAAAGVDEVLLISSQIIFHDIVNIIGTKGKLQFEINAAPGAVAATVDQSVSVLYYDALDGVGVAPSIPTINTMALKASIDSDAQDFGDDVIQAAFINIDKVGITSANQVITIANFQSDKISFSATYMKLLDLRYRMFEQMDQANLRNQCFMLFDMASYNMSGMKVRLNRASVNMTLTAANVVATKNWYVWRKFVNSEVQLRNYASKLPSQAKTNQMAVVPK